MKVAVTGAGGFLGRALVKRLKEKEHEPLAIVRTEETAASYRERGIATLCRDLSIEDACSGIFQGCDALIHCAALTRDFGRWEDFKRVNIDTTRNVMLSAIKSGLEKVIHISTTAVYGNERNHYGTDEEADYGQRVVDPYTRSKIFADKFVSAMAEEKKLPVIILRFGNIWGPGDQNILPFVVDGLKRKKLMIEGGGDNVMSLTYVDNAIESLIAALSKDVSGGIYNITDGVKITSKRFIDDIIGVLGIKYRLRNIPYSLLYSAAYLLEQYYLVTRRTGKPPLTRFAARILKYHAIFDISRAMNELEYRPKITYKEALTLSTAYIRSLYYGSK